MNNQVELTDIEVRIIASAAKTRNYINNPVPAHVKEELTANLRDFTHINPQAKSNLSELYPFGSDVQALVAQDWAAAYESNSLRMFDDNTVSFPLRLALENGAPVEVSIRRNSYESAYTWFMSYVPRKYHLPAAIIDGATYRAKFCRPKRSGGEGFVDAEFVVPEDAVFYYRPGEYAYARIEKYIPADSPEREGAFRLRCIDGYAVSIIKESIVRDKLGEHSNVGQFTWVRLKNCIKSDLLGSRHIAFFRETNYEIEEYAQREQRVFRELRAPGESILAPIISIEGSRAIVALGPNTKTPVDMSASQKFQAEVYPGYVGLFTIEAIPKEGVATLSFDATYQPRPAFRDQLPAKLGDFSIPDRMLEIIRETKLDTASEQKLTERGLSLKYSSRPALIYYIGREYEKEYQNRSISPSYQRGRLAFDVDLGIRTENGVPISAGLKRGPKGNFVMNLFGFTNVKKYFERDIYVSDDSWEQLLEELDGLAIDERWDYEGEAEKGKRYILKQYLRFTYYKSWLDGNVCINEKGEGLFNTGLVDNAYDYIYCYLTKNDDETDFRKRKWRIGGFAGWGKRELRKKIHEDFDIVPQPPEYINREQLEDLFFDTSKELVCDYQHIIEDNLDRLPLTFIEDVVRDRRIRNLVKEIEDSEDESDDLLDELKEAIIKDPERLRDVIDGLERAVSVAIKYARWNYKTAVPIYYPRNNRISLLLPLNLCRESKAADAALVVSRLKNGKYQGETILTLAMAYLDARQVCRPSSEWLTADTIRISDKEETALDQ